LHDLEKYHIVWHFTKSAGERPEAPGTPTLTTRKGRFPMAVYLKRDIEALSQRLEARASVMPADVGRDMMASAMLLRLMLMIAQVKKVETGPIGSLNHGQRLS
jgi:hypothetical protein